MFVVLFCFWLFYFVIAFLWFGSFFVSPVVFIHSFFRCFFYICCIFIGELSVLLFFFISLLKLI